MNYTLNAGRLTADGFTLLNSVEKTLRLESVTPGQGAFMVAQAETTASRHVFELGSAPDLERYVALFRYEPFWMKPKTGSRLQQVPHETQCLLAQLRGDRWLLLVPLLEEPFRFSLRGARDGDRLQLLAETGDASTPGRGGLALFVAHGQDPFVLLEEGAQAVMRRLKTGRLRREKPVPDFVDEFGWCTWDAFYSEVTPADLRRGLDEFRQGGVQPRLLIIDHGWQSEETLPTGETRLTALEPNSKFGGDLSNIARLAKEDYGIRTLLAWHGCMGGTGGVSSRTLARYGVVDQPRNFGEGLLATHPALNHEHWGSLAGLVPASHIHQFYHDYHRMLRRMGVDGVKIDFQGMIEGLAQGQGGRVALIRAYREALEGSVQTHFAGRLINCMSHATETWYYSPASSLIRTSTDFWPNKPDQHGLHLWTNAAVGLWFGEFMTPDWDMFQSAHEWGAYHAAGRALSGGPVYVSDHPGQHDFPLIKRLVCADGSVLRCDLPGRLTPDSLLSDPTEEDALMKVWNRAGPAGLVGVFNARYAPGPEGGPRLRGEASPADVPGLSGSQFLEYTHTSGRARLVGRKDKAVLELGQRGYEIFTYAPVERGFAAAGLVDKLASPAAIERQSWCGPSIVRLHLRDGGAFLAYAKKRPVSVESDGVDLAFTHGEDGMLRADLPQNGRQLLIIRW